MQRAGLVIAAPVGPVNVLSIWAAFFCGVCNRNPLPADTIAIAWLIDQNVVACLRVGVNGYYREDGASLTRLTVKPYEGDI